MSERLSCESSGVPWALITEDRVEGHEEFPHRRSEGQLARAAGGDEALVEGGDDGIVADGGERGHVQHVADGGPAAGNHAAAAEGATVAIDRGDADEGGDFPAVEVAELGEIGDEGVGGNGPDAGDRAQEVFRGPPDWRGAHSSVDVALELTQGVLEPADMGIEAPLEGGLFDEPPAVVLGAQHVDELAAAGDEFAQEPGLRIGHGPGRGSDGGGEPGDGLRVEGIGLGQAAGGTREVANLAGIEDGHGEGGGGQRRRDDDLISPGGLQRNEGDAERMQPSSRATLKVLDGAKVGPTLAGLQRAVEHFKPRPGKPAVPPGPQSVPPPAPADAVTLHLISRGDDRGSWGEFPAENWIVLTREDWSRLLPTGNVNPGQTWEFDRDVSAKILTYFYPQTENNDARTDRIKKHSLAAKALTVKDGVVTARIDGFVLMYHTFYPGRTDAQPLGAEVIGVLTFAPGKPPSLELATTRAAHGTRPFTVAVWTVPQAAR